MNMLKLAVPFALMLAVGAAGAVFPTAANAKETTRDQALVDLKNAKRTNEAKTEGKTDDKGGGKGADDKDKDDKGKDRLVKDDKMKTCYVFVSGGKMSRPKQTHITAADRARLQAEDRMKVYAGMIYYDDAVRNPEKADDPKSYNPRYNLYLKDDRMGRKACVIL
jgi:hypothetical protein